MKILIIGFGSIGKRHFDILSKNYDVKVVSKYKGNFFNLDEVNFEEFDYFVIANETYKHFETLKYINERVKDKIILVEKPLFDKEYDLVLNNKVYVAYNLRFHPLIQKLKNFKDILYINIFVGQDLRMWRKRDYRNSYSADIKKGGGVLKDLSHEIDYLMWCGGDIENISYIDTKISDLDIKSDDLFTAIGKTNKGIVFNISMDYISKKPIRQIIVHTLKDSFIFDLINYNINKNYTYEMLHNSILNQSGKDVCSFEEGMKIVKFITKVKYENIM